MCRTATAHHKMFAKKHRRIVLLRLGWFLPATKKAQIPLPEISLAFSCLCVLKFNYLT
jgi:hypothetical protein